MRAELDTRFSYHSIAHTFDDVLPAAERIAVMLNLTLEEVLLLKAAAVFHDFGFVETRAGHEQVSARIARERLPEFGYEELQIEVIAGIILATRMPQEPYTLLEHILADADLDVLGREDFASRNQDLRDELAAFGSVVSDVEWYKGQLGLLYSHKYFTVLHDIRDAQKQRNIEFLEARLAKARKE
jgi:uncharacterized protein